MLLYQHTQQRDSVPQNQQEATQKDYTKEQRKGSGGWGKEQKEAWDCLRRVRLALLAQGRRRLFAFPRVREVFIHSTAG